MESEKASTIIDLAGVLASRAEEFDKVLILCRKKDGSGYSNDNGLTTDEAVFICETFKMWIIAAVNGLIPPKET